ncbi:MAG: 2-oxoacid:acceptor oxidoreductase subunit alpha, partial [Alphaproteobacteria bacterium]|nr:2-oxoacid:acceptor oxidoreductase subunit alpha [Alphaproteobacteria bacterium]
RGGEAAAMLRFSTFAVDSHDDQFDVLMALDWENVQRFASEIPLGAGSVILADPAAGAIPEAIAKKGAKVVEFPLKDVAKACAGRPNMVALGALVALLKVDPQAAIAVVAKSLKKKDDKALELSKAALAAGAAAADKLGIHYVLAKAPARNGGRWTISGNQAAGLGAIKGGIRFVAAYPITPATEMLEWMAPALTKVGGVLVQAEDELASINMILGGSFAGVPSLTATSGPGLSLMLESFGLGIASETPIVVVNVMRGGPSTGIPTKSEQTDLNIAIYGMHGDAPHYVVAPVSVSDCMFTTQWAVHLAETTQTPAIVLSDQYLGQARAISDRPASVAFPTKRLVAENPGAGYARYALTESGVSPMAIPGTKGGQYTADGLEHGVKGTPSSQASDHQSQLDKRLKKITALDYGNHWAEIDGAGEGEIAIVTWGSTASTAKEALDRARKRGLKARLIALRMLLPVQKEKLSAALAGVKRVMVIEQSHGAQFHHYLRAFYDLPGEVEILARPGPLLYRPDEIYRRLTQGRA